MVLSSPAQRHALATHAALHTTSVTRRLPQAPVAHRRRAARVVHATPPSQQQQQQQVSAVPPEQPGSSSSEEPAYKYSDGVNAFLGNFLPSSRSARQELAVDFDAPKARGLSIEDLAARVERGLAASEWFVTGEVDAAIFSDEFMFKDESVATAGIKAYATGVRKLFDQETARAELISVMPRPATRDILVLWRLEGRVNLPLKPAIKPYVVLTILGLNEQGLICSQVDEFTVPGWDLLLSTLLGHWLGAKPAPPVGELRAAAAAGQLVPQPRNEKK